MYGYVKALGGIFGRADGTVHGIEQEYQPATEGQSADQGEAEHYHQGRRRGAKLLLGGKIVAIKV